MGLGNFFKPKRKKVLLTVILFIFFGFLEICFPVGLYGEYNIKQVLIKRPYCRIVGGEGGFLRKLLKPVVVVKTLVWTILFIFMFVVVALVSIFLTEMPPFAIYFGVFCEILYGFLVCYLISCLAFWIYEKRKEKMRQKSN